MIKLESYTDYPKQASENAKIALRYAEENGWGSCGTAVGKQRANQLAKGEPISRETIARMAAFERHRQNSKKPLGDGCGRLMWLAWGGDAGINWAQRKLKQIDKQKIKKMTTYQNVLNKINETTKKTELKSDKVELALTDDLKTMLKAYRSWNKQVETKGKQLLKVEGDLGKLATQGKGLFAKSDKSIKKAENAIKDLGLPKDSIPQITELKKEIDTWFTYRKRYNLDQLAN